MVLMHPARRGSDGLSEPEQAKLVASLAHRLGRDQPAPKANSLRGAHDSHSPPPPSVFLPPENLLLEGWSDLGSRGESRRTFFILATLAAAVAGLLWWWDPADWHVLVCSFYRLTGWYCPGCGGLRAAHALLHGRLAKAWAYNPLLVLLVPWAGYGLVLWAMTIFWPHRRWPGQWLYGPWALVLVGLVGIVFGILRNLPWEPFCQWAPGP